MRRRYRYTAPWPYRFYGANVEMARLNGWTLTLQVSLWPQEQQPEVLRANGWWHRQALVAVRFDPVKNLDAVGAFFADWDQHQSYGNSLHYLAIEHSRSAPGLLCVELGWDRTEDKLRIFCGAVTVEPWREPDAEG